MLVTRLGALLGSVLLRARARQRVSVPNGTVKLNLGSGLAVAPGWVNVDASPNAMLAGWPKWFLHYAYRLSGERRRLSQDQYEAILTTNRFVHHDVSYGLPFNDATVDFVYSSHMLEHLFPAAAEQLLREAHRVLKPGGVIRICIPDLEFAVSLYQQGDRDRFLAYFFRLDTRNDFGRHHYMYDFGMLQKLLDSTGFARARRLSTGQGATPDCDILDNRADETLYVEAVK